MILLLDIDIIYLEKWNNMNAYKANLINAVTLILLGTSGYFDSFSITALIPVLFGATLAGLSNSIKNNNKLLSHIAVIATLIILVALIGMRLPKSIDQGGVGLFRVISMISTSLLAMVAFVRSFIKNRKSK